MYFPRNIAYDASTDRVQIFDHSHAFLGADGDVPSRLALVSCALARFKGLARKFFLTVKAPRANRQKLPLLILKVNFRDPNFARFRLLS